MPPNSTVIPKVAGLTSTRTALPPSVSAAIKANSKKLRSTLKGSFTRTNVISPELCQKAIKNIDLSMHKNPYIIDMNPGFGLWSRVVHEHVKPREHILLEPDERYHAELEDFAKTHKNVYLTTLSGHDWDTYTNLFSQAPFPIPPFPEDYPGIYPKHHSPELGLHPDLLFIGFNTKKNEADRLVTQWLECIPAQEWVQAFGRVRFLLWIYESSKERLLPLTIQSRSRPTVLAETFCDTTPVVTTGQYRTGRGFQKPKTVTEKAEPPSPRSGSFMGSPARIKSSWEKKRVQTESSALQLSKNWTDIREETWRRRHDLEADWLRQKILHIGSYSTIPPPDTPLEALREMFVKLIDNPPKYATTSTERWSEDRTVLNLSKHISSLPGSYVATPSELLAYQEFEKTHLMQGNVQWLISQSLPDEEYSLSLDPPLLQSQRPHPKPVASDPADFHPANPLALIDFRPKPLPAYFAHADESVRRKRYEVFDWMVRSLFIHRAQPLKRALQMMVPGGEWILEEVMDGKGAEMGGRAVRILTVDEFVKLAEAWEKWPFKPEGFEFEGGSTLGIIESNTGQSGLGDND